jgi:hypothetical protein
MSKLVNESEAKAIANKAFAQYPDAKSFIVTEDGQCFPGDKKSAADFHVKKSGRELKSFEFEKPGVVAKVVDAVKNALTPSKNKTASKAKAAKKTAATKAKGATEEIPAAESGKVETPAAE